MSKFEERLDRLAEVAIRVGLQLKQGQELVLTAPIEALPLVRRMLAGDAAVLGRHAELAPLPVRAR
jgi:leucyl aminopeptidase (aminopeptidase T)